MERSINAHGGMPGQGQGGLPAAHRRPATRAVAGAQASCFGGPAHWNCIPLLFMFKLLNVMTGPLLRTSGPQLGPLLRDIALRWAPCAAQQISTSREVRFASWQHSRSASSGPAGPAAHPSRLLVLHPASLPEYSLQEALRLGESYAGTCLPPGKTTVPISARTCT